MTSSIAETLKVLVVDEDAGQRSALRRLFEQVGVTEITEAASGVVALSLFNGVEDGGLDLVICAHAAMTMDGLEFCTRIWNRSKIGTEGQPVILLTGSSDVLSAENAIRVGLATGLTEPVSAAALSEALYRAVGEAPAEPVLQSA